MNTELTTRLERIKEECRRAISQDEIARPEANYKYDRFCRFFCPRSAHSMLVAIESLEEILETEGLTLALNALTEICAQWEGQNQ